jgi:hypothetical protein
VHTSRELQQTASSDTTQHAMCWMLIMYIEKDTRKHQSKCSSPLHDTYNVVQHVAARVCTHDQKSGSTTSLIRLCSTRTVRETRTRSQKPYLWNKHIRARPLCAVRKALLVVAGKKTYMICLNTALQTHCDNTYWLFLSLSLSLSSCCHCTPPKNGLACTTNK